MKEMRKERPWDRLQQNVLRVPSLSDTELSSWCNVRQDWKSDSSWRRYWHKRSGAGAGLELTLPSAVFRSSSSVLPAGKELVLFIRPLSQSCEPDCLSQDLDSFEIQDIISDCECCEQSRFSVLSTDSGIERDLPAAGEEPVAPCSGEAEHSRLHRKGGIKKKPSPLESVAFLQAGCNGPAAKSPAKLQRRPGTPPEPTAPLQRLHTARILLLGDDRILGRLAQAYHSLR